MTKNVTFHLGPANSLNARGLVITQKRGAGDDSPLAAESDQSLAGATENQTVALPSNQMWEAVLTDTHSDLTTSVPLVLQFHTGELQFPGPAMPISTVIG